MYSQFQTSYQRVDAALQRLTDSIAAYNPSTTAADELVAADEAVNQDIEQLLQHQRNHQTLQSLRRTTTSLDEQIKSTLRTLAATRKDLLSIPASSPNDPSTREVKVSDLLAYAKYIAKTTVPPTLRKSPALPNDGNADAQSAEASTQERGRAVQELEARDKAWLMPTNLPFDPWPSGEVMKAGALGRIQKMLEDGVDPAGVLSAEEQAVVDQKRREEEERQRAEEEERQRRAREEFGYGGRRGTVVEETPFNPDDL